MVDDSDSSIDGSTRREMLAVLGAGTAVGLAGCGSGDPEADEPGGEGTDADAGNQTETDGEDGATPSGERTNADKAQAAWERVENNPGPDAEDLRNEAYVEIEEAVRDDMVLLPLFHNLGERFWYDRVDVEKIGPLGGHRQQHNDTDVEGDSELNFITSSVSTLDPIESTDTASASKINQVYENLVHYPNGQTELENQLVEEVEVSDDNLTYTFTISEAQFHDGSELTAQDFKYSWRRLAESESSQRASFLVGSGTTLSAEHESSEEEGVGPANVVPDSLAIEVEDDRTFSITLASPNPNALDIMAYDAFGVMPEGLVSDVPGYDDGISQEEIATNTMVGTGPFQYDEWVPDSEVRLTRFEDYRDGSANLESIHWQVMSDPDAIYTYGQEGNADIISIPTSFYEPDLVDASEDDQGRMEGQYGPMENGETVNYLGVAEISTFYTAFNVSDVPHAVRQAIAYVTDHSELVEVIFKQRGETAFSFTPPAIWPEDEMAYEDWVDQWPYSRNETDRESARQILEEAGYTQDDPFDITLTAYQENPAFQEFARLTRDKMSGLGINLEVEVAPFSTLISRGEDGDLQMYTLGWIWSWTGVDYGHFGFEPKNTNTELIPTDADGYYLDWHTELEEEA